MTPPWGTIYEINETDDGQLYLVMAHYERETLKERIERGPVELHGIDIIAPTPSSRPAGDC